MYVCARVCFCVLLYVRVREYSSKPRPGWQLTVTIDCPLITKQQRDEPNLADAIVYARRPRRKV